MWARLSYTFSIINFYNVMLKLRIKVLIVTEDLYKQYPDLGKFDFNTRRMKN